MASSTRGPGDEHEDEIRLWREGDGWVITHAETGVTTQGDSREHALAMLDEALALHRGGGESIDTPEQEREVLEAFGIDPDDIESAREDADELPEFMQ